MSICEILACINNYVEEGVVTLTTLTAHVVIDFSYLQNT